MRVVGYGATARGATVNDVCGIGLDLVAAVYDPTPGKQVSTPGKQVRLPPGAHIPVTPMDGFRADPATYTLRYAWHHEAEILAEEPGLREAGGRWIRYMPDVWAD